MYIEEIEGRQIENHEPARIWIMVRIVGSIT